MTQLRPSLGWVIAVAFLATIFSTRVAAQGDYRDLESGRPVRISDAVPTERRAFDLDLTTFRLERLSLGRYRLQFEPRIAYGILPRTEISVRMPSFYRERSISPRGGVAGVGIGAEYQLAMEKLSVPGLGVSAEAFVPAGPNALRTSYSVKGLLTRSFPAGRIHINAGYSTFAVRTSASGVLAPPVIDGPCTVGVPEDEIPVRGFCGVPQGNVTTADVAPVNAAAASTPGAVVNKGKWAGGFALDKAFPLSSTLIAGDVFVEKYEGIGRPAEWNAELGSRHQLTPRVVLDGAIGRRFTGIAVSWFATFGTTLNVPGL
jgi:hypothetical protein